MKLSAGAQQAIARLEHAGFETWAVGGCVRDALRGVDPHDFDLCTAARPAQLQQVFAGERLIETGLQHGTITVLLQGEALEITTFRADGAYSDGRHPDAVRFVGEVQADLARRDFTVNAMAYHPQRGVCDPFGGQQDLQDGILRAVGDADTRFQEDALRMLRAVRFSAQLGFRIDEQTAAAMWRQRERLQLISAERIREEFSRTLTQPYTARVLREQAELLATVLPEVRAMFGFAQHNAYHRYDVWEHTLRAIEHAPPVLTVRLALLLHDSGKPLCYTRDEQGVGHFYGHNHFSAQLAQRILTRLRFDHATMNTVLQLVDWHDHPLGVTEKAMRRSLHRVGEQNCRLLLAVKKGDCVGHGTHMENIAMLLQCEQMLGTVLAQQQCFTLRQLAIGGRELMALGLQGRAVGEMLDYLLDIVLENAAKNERETLLELARRRMEAV